MTYKTSKGKYLAKNVKEYIITVTEDNQVINTLKVVGTKKTASNKIKELQKKELA